MVALQKLGSGYRGIHPGRLAHQGSEGVSTGQGVLVEQPDMGELGSQPGDEVPHGREPGTPTVRTETLDLGPASHHADRPGLVGLRGRGVEDPGEGGAVAGDDGHGHGGTGIGRGNRLGGDGHESDIVGRKAQHRNLPGVGNS